MSKTQSHFKARKLIKPTDLEIMIDAVQELIDDEPAWSGLTMQQRDETVNYLLDLQIEYRRQKGHYYINRNI